MVMREAKSVQRTPEAKLLGASKDFAAVIWLQKKD